MTLLRLVADMIEEAGSGTADTLLPSLSELGYKRPQVLQALKNAKRKGCIVTDGSGRGFGLVTYYPPRSPMKQMVRAMTKEDWPQGMISSVFHLATPIQPPQPPAVRTIHTPLGSWNSEEAA